jgi:hypothetical protein
MRRAIPPLPKYVSMVWCLVKHRDNLPSPLNLRGRVHSEDKGVDRKIILVWILEKQHGKLWTGLICDR